MNHPAIGLSQFMETLARSEASPASTLHGGQGKEGMATL